MGNPQKSKAGQDLHGAARSGDLSAVQSILSSDPLAVNSRDKHSRTPYPFSFFSFCFWVELELRILVYNYLPSYCAFQECLCLFPWKIIY